MLVPTPLCVRRYFFLLLSLTTSIQVEDTHPGFPLSTVINRQRIHPGIKDLPDHICTDFRNTFIRLVIRDLFNSEQPWANPDLSMLQHTYDSIYSTYPARLRHGDAVCHPVSSTLDQVDSLPHPFYQTFTSLSFVRNRIGVAGVSAVQRHLANVFRQRQLKRLDARAKFVSEKFKSNDDHPFIWNQYVISDIPNHPGTGGYQTVSGRVPSCRPPFTGAWIGLPRRLPV